MKRERLHLPGGRTIETGRDWNGRFYVCYGQGVSVFVRCPKAVKEFLALPDGRSRESLDSWLESLPQVAEEDPSSPP